MGSLLIDSFGMKLILLIYLIVIFLQLRLKSKNVPRKRSNSADCQANAQGMNVSMATAIIRTRIQTEKNIAKKSSVRWPLQRKLACALRFMIQFVTFRAMFILTKNVLYATELILVNWVHVLEMDLKQVDRCKSY